jgi:cytochrome c oxidase subunit II
VPSHGAERSDAGGRVRAAVRASSVAAALGALILLPSCTFGMPPGSTVQGRHISWLYQLLFWFAIPIGGLVYGLIVWSVIRYRRRRNDDGSLPKQTRYNLPLEIVYTAVPVVIVLVLFGFTLSTMSKVDAVTSRPSVTVNVTGFRWQWRFDFPSAGFSIVGVGGSPSSGPTILLPAGETVHVTLRAADVIHSFFVPDFNFKRDAIPGVTNQFDLSIPQAGVFRGECAELCGVDHSDMTFFIRAVPPDQFRAWLDQHKGQGVIQEPT